MSLDSAKAKISELLEDATLPKAVKDGLEKVNHSLDKKPLDIHKSLQELEEVIESNDLESYTRTQLWDLMSLLESLR